MPRRAVLGEHNHGLLWRCSRPGCWQIDPRAEGVALPTWVLNSPQSKVGFAYHHSCYLYFLLGRAVWLEGSIFFFLRGENCGKYFVFPGSQAMYLLQVLLNEL